MTLAELHPLEIAFNAPAADILEAIEHGFRAQVDVKGKLAELYLSRYFERLKAEGKLLGHEWHDADGEADFVVLMPDGRRLVVECKNCRSPKVPKPPKPPVPGRRTRRASPAPAQPSECKVELQKTRSGKDAKGAPTRGYLVTDFDLLAVCTFNKNREWKFRFIPSARLALRPEDSRLLVVMQPVPLAGEDGPWSDDFMRVVADKG